MRTLTETFDLHGNDMYARELTSDETNEVAGGTGNALVQLTGVSGTASTLTIDGTATLATSNTTALAVLTANIHAAGANNSVSLASAASVT
jgi:hypothetical protein